MMIVLSVGSASSVAAAVCQHESAQAHAAALQSHDGKAASDARMEDAARAFTSKSGLGGNAGWAAVPMYMLPPTIAAVPPVQVAVLRPRPPDAPDLPSLSLPPLLKPPTA